MNRITWKAAPLLFGSGLCALVYQVAWQRELRLVFGATTAASAAVLAIFIGGMGLGGLLLGPRADAHPKPLGLYARLEIGISVAAALSAPLLWLIRSIYFALGGHSTLGPVGATLARLVLTTLVLAVPTILMGGTLPAIARAVTGRSDEGRRALSLLYGINTLGAVGGALLSTFAMLEVFGTRMTLWMAALINLLIALVANMMSRQLESDPVSPAPEEPAQVEDLHAELPLAGGSSKDRLAPAWFVLLASAAVGFAFFLMELVWFRMLSPLLGGTVFTFGLILAVALFGIGLGGAFYSVIFRGRAARLHWFAITCIAEAAFIAIGWALGDKIALLALQLRSLSIFGFSGFVASWAIVTGVLVIPAAFVSGLQFPMLIALLGRGRDNVGKDAGYAYAANTFGAMAGSLAGGFGLIPLLTAPGCWQLVVILLAVLGLVAAAIAFHRERQVFQLVAPALGIAICFALLGAEGPTAAWRHSSIGAGRASEIRSDNEYRQWRNLNRGRVVKEWDGVESSVALVAQNDLSFMVNGKSDGAAFGDSPTQVMLGLLGTLLHPEPKKAAVIGLGTGSSAGWMAREPSLEQVDVVEIERVMLDVARACDPVNGGVLDNPKVNVIFEDAREFLATTPEQYDIIVSEPSNPYRAGIASLFTEEFYEAVAKRLQPGGYLLQWVQGYEIDARTLQTIFATLETSFPHIEAWELRKQDLLLVASREPLVHDVERMRARVAAEPYRTALASAWRTNSLEGVLAHYVAAPSFLKRMLNEHQGEINTDDLSPVEFRFAREVGGGATNLIADMRWSAARFDEHRPLLPEDSVDWNMVAEAFHAFPMFVDGFAATEEPTRPLEWRQLARSRFVNHSDFVGALMAWQNQEDPPVLPQDIEIIAMALADSGDDEARAHVETLRGTFPPADVDGILARLDYRQGRVEEAKAHVVAALERYREYAWVSHESMYHTLMLAREIGDADPSFNPELMRLLERPFAIYRLDSRRKEVRLGLSQTNEDIAACAQALEEVEPFVPWDRGFLAARQACYDRAGHRLAEQATKDLEKFRTNEPLGFASVAPRPPPSDG